MTHIVWQGRSRLVVVVYRNRACLVCPRNDGWRRGHDDDAGSHHTSAGGAALQPTRGYAPQQVYGPGAPILPLQRSGTRPRGGR